MSSPAAHVKREVDHLYKKLFGKMVTSLLYFSSSLDLETAEDLVQDTFSSALIHWTQHGIPTNPAGWIFSVCRNKVLNTVKAEKKIRVLFEGEDFGFEEEQLVEPAISDQQVSLLFACAHPDLSPKIQVVLTLKYVANLKVEAIAKTFAMTVDGVDKLLLRARQKIKDEKILLEVPDFATLKKRLSTVHTILYLIFNEGYKASWGKELIREELCDEALTMTTYLLNNQLGNHETSALYALMLFNAARFKARFGPAGELLDLEEQDRLLWDKRLIQLATHYFGQSRGDVLSSYHYEASIAYLHCTARDFTSTDWTAISQLYLQLYQAKPNPFVKLNYAIALYYAGHKQKALTILYELKQKPFLNQYYLLNATLGKIHLLEGNQEKAREFLLQTLSQAELQTEKDYIRRLLKRLE